MKDEGEVKELSSMYRPTIFDLYCITGKVHGEVLEALGEVMQPTMIEQRLFSLLRLQNIRTLYTLSASSTINYS